MHSWEKYWPTIAVASVLLLNLSLTLLPYRGNVTALFHGDALMHREHPFPREFVVLRVPAYDGIQYYQIARSLPSVFSPSEWPKLAAAPQPGPNAYQRFLLPLAAWILADGREALLPFAFLAINLVSLLLVFRSALQWRGAGLLGAFALALSPPALIGLHFSLAEPLTLFLLLLFLIRYQRRESLSAPDVLLLSLLGLSREVNVLFLGGTLAFSLWKRRWKDAALLLIPLAIFLGLQLSIAGIFGQIPLLLSTAKHTFPLQAIGELLTGQKGYTLYTSSSIALFLLFVLPATVCVTSDILRTRRAEFVPCMLLLFLLVMLAMPGIIWGSITSIGRVITPVYPLFIAFYGVRRTRWTRAVTVSILLLGLASGFGLAILSHPFTLS